jgi:hypothetical protein
MADTVADTARESVQLSRVTRGFPDARERPTFVQLYGVRFLGLLIWVICGLIAAFFATWCLTRPTFTSVQGMFGDAVEPKVVVDTLRELRRDHVDHYRDIFQLLVLSGLVPLVTLFAGYTFGRQESERNTRAETDGDGS